MTVANIGTWDGELFARFRALVGPPPARGKAPRPLSPEARRMQHILMVQNEPLVKLLVDQLCGRGEPKKGRPRKKLGGLIGAEHIPWEDAMQAGRIALSKALLGLDPTKGKLSGYLLFKIRYELQCILPKETTIYAPRGKEKERPDCRLVGEQVELDALSRESEFGGISEIDGLTPEMIQQWASTGEWPELEDFEAQRAAARTTKIISIPSPAIVLTPLEQWLKDECRFATTARVTQWDLQNAVRLSFRARGLVEPSRSELVSHLATWRGVREMRVRDLSKEPRRGLAGVRLTTNRPGPSDYENRAKNASA